MRIPTELTKPTDLLDFKLVNTPWQDTELIANFVIYLDRRIIFPPAANNNMTGSPVYKKPHDLMICKRSSSRDIDTDDVPPDKLTIGKFHAK